MNEIETAAALLRENGWTVIAPTPPPLWLLAEAHRLNIPVKELFQKLRDQIAENRKTASQI